MLVLQHILIKPFFGRCQVTPDSLSLAWLVGVPSVNVPTSASKGRPDMVRQDI